MVFQYPTELSIVIEVLSLRKRSEFCLFLCFPSLPKLLWTHYDSTKMRIEHLPLYMYVRVCLSRSRALIDETFSQIRTHFRVPPRSRR